MKRFLMPALIVIIVIQLLVPTYMIANRYFILYTGEEFKFRVRPFDPYDPFHGRYVYFTLDSSPYSPTGSYEAGNHKYSKIDVGEDGFARFKGLFEKKPKDAPYIKSVKKDYFNPGINKYYMEEKMAPAAEKIVQERASGKEIYVTVKVKNGNAVVTGLYVDGVPVEDIIKKEMKKT